MEEVWKDVKGFEGFYQVSSLGNIKSLNRIIKRRLKGDLPVKEKILNKRLNDSGYNTVWLSKDGKEYNKKIARLVAINFKDNPKHKAHVNHIDGNKINDNEENLEWCTPSENEKHAHRIGLKNYRGSLSPSAKLNEESVIEIRKLYKKGNTIYRELGKIYNVKPATICSVILRKNWKHI